MDTKTKDALNAARYALRETRDLCDSGCGPDFGEENAGLGAYERLVETALALVDVACGPLDLAASRVLHGVDRDEQPWFARSLNRRGLCVREDGVLCHAWGAEHSDKTVSTFLDEHPEGSARGGYVWFAGCVLEDGKVVTAYYDEIDGVWLQS